MARTRHRSAFTDFGPRHRRRWAVRLPLTLMAPGLVFLVTPTPAASALDPGCTQNSAHMVSCTLNASAGPTHTVTVPAGATQMDYIVVGGSGGNSATGSGGRGARINGTRTVSGGQVYVATFPNDGGIPGPGAGAGGGSSVLSTGSTTIVHAAGGGGAGADSGSNAGGFGAGAGFNGGVNGGSGGGGAQGGFGATSSSHGAGGAGACTFGLCVDDGNAGSNSSGGSGGNEPGTGVGGGGGGGGAFKGGGGGAGFGGGSSPGGGGGSGSSVRPIDATFVQASFGAPRQVILTFRSPLAQVSQTQLNFGNVPVGTTSAALFATVTNVGSASLTISNVGFGHTAFSRGTSCLGSPLAPGSSCQIDVRFSPVTIGTISTTMSIVSNSMDGIEQLTVTGTGTQPQAFVSPTALTFGSALVGQQTSDQAVTMRNTGNANLVISSAQLTGTDPLHFVKSSDGCTGATLAPNATCVVNIAFRPTSTGAKTAQLRFTHNAPTSPQNVGLSGTGTQPEISLRPPTQIFGEVEIGDVSGTELITIQNPGTGPLEVSSVELAGPNPQDFVIGDHACVGTIPAGGSCDVPVSFEPRKRGSRLAFLDVTHNAAGGMHSVGLTGFGIALGDLQIRGPGSVYTSGGGSLVTLAVAAGGTATYRIKVVNTSDQTRAFELGLTQNQAASAPKITLGTGVELPKNGEGNYVTKALAPGGSIIYLVKVKVLAPGQVISGVDVHLVAANGADHDFARTETNVKAPTKGTDSFTLFAKAGSQANIGGSVDGQTTTAISVAQNGTTKFTVTLRNDGPAAKAMTFRMSGPANPCWTTAVTTKQGLATVDITSQAMGSGYLSRVLAVNSSQAITVTMKRVATSCGAQTWQVASYDGGTLKHFSYLLANPSV